MWAFLAVIAGFLDGIFSTLFWACWVVLFLASFTLLYHGTKAPKAPRLAWWQGPSPIYQIYPRSFQDSNGDGIGDLKGIQRRLGYLKKLGITTIWLSPIYKSPMKDYGYDISDFKQVDPIFGTLGDFDSMVQEMELRGMKLIMDLVVNHTSDQHEWFQKSQARVAPFTDYYVWSDPLPGTKNQPPNNWLSVFGGSAWTWSKERGQFYFHQFFKEQPDLNLRNLHLRKEILDIFKFWMDRGVHGFRLDAIKHGFEVENFVGRHEPPRPDYDPSARAVAGAASSYDSLLHVFTTNQPETFVMLREWRDLLDKYSEKDNIPRILVPEVYDDNDEVVKYFGDSVFDPLSHFPFNFNLLTGLNKENLSGMAMKKIVVDWIGSVPPHGWHNWVVGNHDNGRVSSRFHPGLVDAINMVVMLLPGTPVTYYGEELGLKDGLESPDEDTRDPMGRDVARGPMPWDKGANAGFTSGNPWLPLSRDNERLNVEDQMADKASHLAIYKRLIRLRSQPSFMFGPVEFPLTTKSVFSFIRRIKGDEPYLVAVNLSGKRVRADFTLDNSKGYLKFPPLVGTNGVVILRSGVEVGRRARVDMRAVTLGPREGMVIRLPL